MKSMNRGAFCALMSTILVVLGLQMHFASATYASSSPATTLAMVPAPLGNDAVPSLAQPALLCGNVWVKTTYVLPRNCLKACLAQGHTRAECNARVPLCRRCWSELLACAKTEPVAFRCDVCTQRYAACIGPFLH